jgi:hypothetical protein
MAFCGVSRVEDLDPDWDLGDWIVLKSYLVDNSDQIKVRRVVKKEGNTYTAMKNTDLIIFYTNGAISDARTSTKQNNVWVKALPPAAGTNVAPGTYGVPARTARVTVAPNIPGSTRTPPPEPRATAPTTTATRTADQSVTDNIQSIFPTPAGKDTTYNFDNTERKRFLARRVENSAIYLTDSVPNDCKIQGVPIFGYFITGERVKTIFNSKTMEDVRLTTDTWAAIEPELTKYDRTPVSDKRDLGEGDLVFIKSHSKYFGYVAKVLSTSLTARGDKYIYLRVPGAGSSNRLTLTPVALDKLTPAT